MLIIHSLTPLLIRLFVGSMELDISHLPSGFKSQYDCGNERKDGQLSLFKQKRASGWWPFTANKGKPRKQKEEEKGCSPKCLSFLCCPLMCCCWCAGLKRESPLTKFRNFLCEKITICARILRCKAQENLVSDETSKVCTSNRT